MTWLSIQRWSWKSKRIGLALRRILFGDRIGLALFAGSILFFTLSWRVGFLINDNYTIANSLVAVGDGNLFLSRVVYGPKSGYTPGMHIVSNRLYGRNFGHVFLSLPILWLLESVSTVVDPRIFVVGVWSFLLLGFVNQVGILVGHRGKFDIAGSVAAVLLFTVNTAVAHPLWPYWFEQVALQLSTMVAAAFVSVLLYRLVSDIYEQRTGLFAGVISSVASPVGFWATIPKRHSFTALCTVAAVYGLYRSRIASSGSAKLRFRMVSYVWVGLMAWIHAPEGILLLFVLGIIDVLTAKSHSLRHVIIIGSVGVAATVPMFLTNMIISGDPTAVPRRLPSFHGSQSVLGIETDAGEQVGNASLSDTSSDDSDTPDVGFTTMGIILVFLQQLLKGLFELVNVSDLYLTFIRWGAPVEPWRNSAGTNIDLAVLQSMPILGAITAVPVVAYKRAKRSWDQQFLFTPRTTVDLFAATYILVLLLIYLPRLPINSTVTVRYLHPLYPLGIYMLARLNFVRRVLSEESRLLVWSYFASVVLGGPLLVIVLLSVPIDPVDHIQFHGLLTLGLGLLLAVWSLTTAVKGGAERSGAILLGLAAGSTTTFVILARYLYFASSSGFAIPILRFVADAFESLL